jgi:hypothetical protein
VTRDPTEHRFEGLGRGEVRADLGEPIGQILEQEPRVVVPEERRDRRTRKDCSPNGSISNPSVARSSRRASPLRSGRDRGRRRAAGGAPGARSRRSCGCARRRSNATRSWRRVLVDQETTRSVPSQTR